MQILLNGMEVNDQLERIRQEVEAKSSSLALYRESIDHSDYQTLKEVCKMFSIYLPTLCDWTNMGC